MNDSFIQLIIDAAESHADKMAMQIVGVEGTEISNRICRARPYAYALRDR